VVGPSGSGKDSLLRGARNYFGDCTNPVFVRRYITRPPDGSEDNYFIDPIGFTLLKRANFFISTWQAHGNLYGIPAHVVDGSSEHELILLSISRSAIADFEQRYEKVTTIEVAVREELLLERLKKRGREKNVEIQRRLMRAKQPVVARELITFDNSSNLNRSIVAFIEVLQNLTSKLVCAP